MYLCSANTEDADSIDSKCTKVESALDGSRTIDAPYAKQNAGITTAGDYYVAVTYVILKDSDQISSQPEFSETTINIPPPPGECYVENPPASCISIWVPTVKSITVQTCAECSSGYEIAEIALANVEVRIEDTSGSKIASMKTDSTGKIQPFKLDTASEMSLGADYTVVAFIPVADFNPSFRKKCRNYNKASDSITGDYCEYVIGERTVSEAKDFTVPFEAVPSTGGGGAEIGNANGDGAVNLFDIAEIKPAMGTTSSDTCYRAWADFNLDGNVNLFDFAVLKTYMGTEIDVSGDFDPALVSSKDPYSGRQRLLQNRHV